MERDIPKYQRRDLSPAKKQPEQEEKPHISTNQFILMFIFAVFIDILQFLTSFLIITGPILAFVAWFVLTLWYMMLGLTSSTRFLAKSLTISVISFLLESLSIGTLPTITIGVVVTFMLDRGEKVVHEMTDGNLGV